MDKLCTRLIDDGGSSRRNLKLVPAIKGAGIVALIRDQGRGHLCRDHRECGPVEAFANQGSSYGCSERLCASEASSEGRRHWPGFMPRLQLPMGLSIPSCGDAEGAQDGEHAEKEGLLE